MRRLTFILIVGMILSFSTVSHAYDVSGTVSGAEGLELVVVVGLPATLDTLYLTVALPFVFTYSLSNLDSGSYVLGAYHDANVSGFPDLGESYGFYGGALPELLTVDSDLEGIDIEMTEPTTGGFQGEISYEGEQTGLTLVAAYDNPDFSGTPSGAGFLFNNAGNGNYTAITDTQGTYYAFAFMDLNSNLQYDPEEPFGAYGGEEAAPIVIEAPNYPDDIDITMVDSGISISPRGLGQLPAGFRLDAPYPNPFNSETTIPFTLPASAEIALCVYNLTGQRVAVIASGMYGAGDHRVQFSASDVGSGVYFVELAVDGLKSHQRVLLIR